MLYTKLRGIGRRYARADELGIPYAVTIDFDSLGCGAAEAPPGAIGTATLRERDSTEQVRLPLDDIPETLGKLCSAHPLTFADLLAAHKKAGGAADAAAVPADGKASMIEYLHKHGIAAKLNDAVNALGAAQPDDPVAFLVQHLQKS